MDTAKEIKTMKLYSDVERIYKELGELGYSKTDALKVEDVNKFDQYHFYGTEPVMEGINKLGINSSNKVLEFGAGIGGPSRFIVNKTNCEMLAVELQADLNETATDLTKRCGLDEKLKHLCGDILKLDMESSSFDFIVDWLAILHIEDRKTLFSKCFRLLKPGGKIYSEDLYKLSDYDASFAKMLKENIYIPYLPTKDEYIQQMEEAGFTDIQFEDQTDTWVDFVTKRFQNARAVKERYISLFGQATFDNLMYFYTKSYEMFTSTKVGGCKILATKT